MYEVCSSETLASSSAGPLSVRPERMLKTRSPVKEEKQRVIYSEAKKETLRRLDSSLPAYLDRSRKKTRHVCMRNRPEGRMRQTAGSKLNCTSRTFDSCGKLRRSSRVLVKNNHPRSGGQDLCAYSLYFSTQLTLNTTQGRRDIRLVSGAMPYQQVPYHHRHPHFVQKGARR